MPDKEPRSSASSLFSEINCRGVPSKIPVISVSLSQQTRFKMKACFRTLMLQVLLSAVKVKMDFPNLGAQLTGSLTFAEVDASYKRMKI